MIKYIRTKDEILKVDAYDNSGTCVIKTDTYPKTYYKEEYIKMADTIEELCDEFVFVDFGIISDKEYHFKTLEESKKSNWLYDRCYGAIWTDKGLIYVAKMNNKGEFKLI